MMGCPAPSCGAGENVQPVDYAMTRLPATVLE